MTNTRLGINTITPTRTLDVNGSISGNSEYFLYDGEFKATVGNIIASSLPGAPDLMPGFTSIINDSQWAAGIFNVQGTITDGVSDSALSAGQLVYYRGATSRWALADADAAATTDFTLGIVLNTVGAAAADISILLDGICSTTFTNGIGTVGDLVYVSQTAGNFSGAVPTAAATIVRGVGATLGNNGAWWTINFRPDTTYFTNG
jgi:hypothetical protein